VFVLFYCISVRATQGLSTAPKSSSTGGALATYQSSVSSRYTTTVTQQCDALKRPNPTVTQQCDTLKQPIFIVTQQCDALKQPNPTGTQQCDALKRPNAIKPAVNYSSGLPEKKLYSVDEIERKRQEAMQRRSKALLNVKSYR